MICEKCSAEIRQDALFCTSCGEPVSKSIPFEQRSTQTNDSKAEETKDQTPEVIPRNNLAKDNPSPKAPSKKKMAVIIAACVLVIAFVGGFAAIKLGGASGKLYCVPISLQAEGYDDSTDTRFPVQVTGTDAEGEPYDAVAFLNSQGEGLELDTGEYDITFPASPLTESGTFYTTPSDSFHISVPEKFDPTPTNDAEAAISISYEPKDTLSVTDDEQRNALDYAKKDAEDNGKAKKNDKKLTEARQEAKDEQERKIAEERGANKGSYQERLNAIIASAESDPDRGGATAQLKDWGYRYADQCSGLADEIRAYINSLGDESLVSAANDIDATLSADLSASEAKWDDGIAGPSITGPAIASDTYDAQRKRCQSLIDLL